MACEWAYLPLLPKGINHTECIFNAFTPFITFHVDLFVLISGYFGIKHWKASVFGNIGAGGEFCIILFFVTMLFILCCFIDKVRITITKQIEKWCITKINSYVRND